MASIDYVELLKQAFEEYADLIFQRREVELTLAQKEQFIRATVNMLPEEQRPNWEMYLDKLSGDDAGLSGAIRRILRSSSKKFHTATEVKKALVAAGYNFSSYKTNPLSSVHAALKRLKPDEAQMETIDGVMAWRWVGKLAVAPTPMTPALQKMFDDFWKQSGVTRTLQHVPTRRYVPTRRRRLSQPTKEPESK
jgi:hypothetical protein